ncbi:MAG: TatD family hydrolase [Pseudomonadota bacterium]|nr:TatD family hydrolase [Pseudomonadota bacterium]
MAKVYSGKHAEGCHKCGGYPGSPTKSVPVLFQCSTCGFFTCSKHLGGGIMGRACPNCKGKKLRKAMTAGAAKKAMGGGMPGQIAGKSGNQKAAPAGIAGSGGFSALGSGAGVGGRKPPQPKNQEDEKAKLQKTQSMDFKPSDKEGGSSDGGDTKKDKDKGVMVYTDSGEMDGAVRVQQALADSLSQNVHLAASSSGHNMDSALGVGVSVEADQFDMARSQGNNAPAGASASSAGENIRVEVDEYGTERIFSIDHLGNETMISEKKTEAAEAAEEKEEIEGAIMDAERLIGDHEKGGHNTYSTLSDAYFRISSLDSFKDYKKSLEKFNKQGISIVSIDASNGPLMEEISKSYMDLKNTYYAIGISPTSIRPNSKFDVSELLEPVLRNNPKVVAIGEIGLDLHFAPYTRPQQELIFMEQVQLAVKYNKPIFITSKKADDILPELMNTVMTQTPVRAAIVPIIRTPSMMQMALYHGFYVLMRPEISYPEEDVYRELMREIPRSKTLLASSSEHIAPFTKKGQWNSPAFLDEMVKFACSFLKQPEHQKSKLEDEFTKNLLSFLKG